MEFEFEFHWGGENPKYGKGFSLSLTESLLNYTMGVMFELKMGFIKVVRKIGKELGYAIDVSKIEQTMEIRYRKAGEKDGNILELITSDAKVVEMVGCMPCNRVLVLYYTDLENSNGNEGGSQASAAWPSLDSAEYNYDADVENGGKGVTWHAFSEPGDADADLEVGNEWENEAATTENGEVGNEWENEAAAIENGQVGNEGKMRKMMQNLWIVIMNLVNKRMRGPSGEPSAGENVGPTVQPNAGENVEPTIDPTAGENVGPTFQPYGHEKVRPTYEAPWTQEVMKRIRIRVMVRKRAKERKKNGQS
ncbi:unnamed protein product [Prunus armeniaca]